MTYEVLYVENGDIVATYDSKEEAIHRLAIFLRERPELLDELVVRLVDPAGFAVADAIKARDFAGEQLHLKAAG